AAAQHWGVPLGEVRAEMHQVKHEASGRAVGYGELAKVAASLPVPKKDEIRLKSPAEFRYIGTDVEIVDNFDITTGKAIYSVDVRFPGMLYAVIARPPVYGGRVSSFDDSKAREIGGVEAVF